MMALHDVWVLGSHRYVTAQCGSCIKMHKCVANSEQCTWAVLVKLEMTQHNGRPNKMPGSQCLQGVTLPFLWQPVSRDIRGDETHWSVPMCSPDDWVKNLLKQDSVIIHVNTIMDKFLSVC